MWFFLSWFSYFTSLLFFSFLISFCLFYPFLFKALAPGQPKQFFSYPENHNVFCKTIKCKVNWYKVASVKYNYFWMITSKNYLKWKVHIFLKINCFNFLLRWFLSQSLCLSLYRFPNEKLCFRPQLVLKNLATVLS